MDGNFREAMTRAVIAEMTHQLEDGDDDCAGHLEKWLTSVGEEAPHTVSATLAPGELPGWVAGERSARLNEDGNLEFSMVLEESPAMPVLVVRTSATASISYRNPDGGLEAAPLEDAQQETLDRYAAEVAFRLTGIVNGELLEMDIAANAKEFEDEELYGELDKLLENVSLILEELDRRNAYLPEAVSGPNKPVFETATRTLESLRETYGELFRPMRRHPEDED